MNKRTTPEGTPMLAASIVDGHVDLLRTTETGELQTFVYNVAGALALVDGDGVIHFAGDGCRLLVVKIPYGKEAWLDKLIDSAELMIHHTWGRRPMNEATVTPHDIRTAGRQSKDDIPF